jgi:hypothetical protein
MVAILRAVNFGTERWIDASGTRLHMQIWGEHGGATSSTVAGGRDVAGNRRLAEAR